MEQNSALRAHVDARQRHSPRSSSNGIAADAQASTPWEITDTAPYFHDVSITDLETSVRQHVDKM